MLSFIRFVHLVISLWKLLRDIDIYTLYISFQSYNSDVTATVNSLQNPLEMSDNKWVQ